MGPRPPDQIRRPRVAVQRRAWINDTGQITGAYDDADGHHGFLLQRGRWTRIDAPGRMATDAWGSNDRGQIVIPELGTGLVPVTR